MRKISFVQVPLPEEQSISTCHPRMSTEICYWGIVEYDNVLILPYCSPYVSLDHYIEMRSPFQLTRNIHLLLHLCLLRYSILKRIKSLLFVMKDSLVVYFPVPHLLNSAVV